MHNILIRKPINKQYICKLVFPKIISVILVYATTVGYYK